MVKNFYSSFEKITIIQPIFFKHRESELFKGKLYPVLYSKQNRNDRANKTKAVYYKFLWLNFNFNLLTISLQPFSMVLKHVQYTCTD